MNEIPKTCLFYLFIPTYKYNLQSKIFNVSNLIKGSTNNTIMANISMIIMFML